MVYEIADWDYAKVLIVLGEKFGYIMQYYSLRIHNEELIADIQKIRIEEEERKAKLKGKGKRLN